MNNCILMAEIVQAPQLRYTSENQTPIAEMLVKFPSLRDEDPPAMLKVVGWGNLAQEIQAHYHQGDQVIIEGRLGMNTINNPEGFKEKRAELTVQKIHLIAATATNAPATWTAPKAGKTKNASPKKTAPKAVASVGAVSSAADDIPW